MPQELTEQDVRAMRDQVFESASTDNNWEACKQFWMQPSETAWLLKKIRTAQRAIPTNAHNAHR